MVALVTGAWGFLGGAIAERLEADGLDVVRAGRPEHELPSASFDELLAGAQPTLVIHCAGPASVPASVTDPAADYRGSVDVVAALGESLRHLAPQARLLHLSSAAVYGQPERLPVVESAPLEAVSPYGFHRIACEVLIEGMRELHGIPTAVMRVFSAYGEGLRRQVMWDVCARALREGRVTLTGTGRESRDFVHARDVAQAASVIASESPFEGDVYNVGTGVETTVAALAELLVDELGVGDPILFSGDRRTGDPSNWQADPSRLRTLGFEPSVAIEPGARAYARWARAALEEDD